MIGNGQKILWYNYPLYWLYIDIRFVKANINFLFFGHLSIDYNLFLCIQYHNSKTLDWHTNKHLHTQLQLYFFVSEKCLRNFFQQLTDVKKYVLIYKIEEIHWIIQYYS